MRLVTILFFLTAFLQVNAQSFNDITIKKDRASLETVFIEIEKQSEFRFFFNETLMKQAVPVTIDVKKVSLNKVLEACFEMQPALTYAIVEKTVVVKRKGTRSTEVSMAGKDFGRLAELRGVVASERGPISSATVLVKGTDKVTTTNSSGEFLLYDIDDRAVLVVTHVTHLEQEVRLNGKGLINIVLSERVGELDEQLVVAYNTRTKRNNVGAVTVIKGSEIQTLPNRSFDKSLQGFVPGLLVTQGSGQPGGGVANFVLRGIATGGDPGDGSSVRSPLIVVDGIPVFQDPAQASTSTIAINNPMAQLNPSDIETITVLKDAAAIALYGAKASNGVVLVTTKKGKGGKTVFGFRHQTDLSSRLDPRVEVLNQQEYLELVYETYRNTNPTLWTDNRIKADLLKKFPYQVSSQGDTSFYPVANWLDALYKSNATTFTNELSITGGNDRSNFYLSLEYTKQNGIEIGSGFDRKSLRFNYENRVTSNIKIGLNTALSHNIQNYSGDLSQSVATLISPLNPIYDANGDYIYNYKWGFANTSNLNTNNNNFYNPLAAAKLNINRNISYRGLSKFYAGITFLKNFNFTSSVGVDFMLTEAKEKVHPKLAASGFQPGIGKINETDIRNANIIANNILRFDKSFGTDHQLNILAGHEAQVLTNKYLFVTRQDLTQNPSTDQLYFNGSVADANGLSSKQTLLSYFGQANYGFKDRYFISASVRTDGSSLFGNNNRFGSHWSTGAGWVISSEPFMEKTHGWLNFLKIRGSLGSAGNSSAILNSMRYDRMMITNFLNGVAVYPDYINYPGNPGIRWEKTFNWDAGLELRILKQRVSITADIYSRKTSDLIGIVNLPQATGFYNTSTNIGDLKNNGIELSLYIDVIKSKAFRWNINANWSKNKNRLTRSFLPIEFGYSGTTLANGVGENYNSFYLVRWAGVDPATGKPQWIDSTGKVSSNYNAAKREFVGKPQPDGFGAVTNFVSYKGFDFSFMLYYQYGFQIYNNPGFRPTANDGLDPFINQTKNALDRWQKPGDIVANPRRLLFGRFNGVSDNGTRNSTRFLTEGDFIRLSNVGLAYNFPKRILDRLHINALKIILQGYNLATWTKFTGRGDPEYAAASGTALYTYPLQRSYSMGINMNF